MTRNAVATLLLLASTLSASAGDAPPGASSCSGCHPASRWTGTDVPRLVGRNAAEIATALSQFRAGTRPATIMDRIAKGFSDDEVKAIAAWYAAQKD